MFRIKRLLPILFITLLATTNFLLLLRHKSPFVSDSNFYLHQYYRIQSYSFADSYKKVIAKIDMSQQDEISRNFYLNQSAYRNSLSFFERRPVYPLMAIVVNFIVNNDYVAFLIPEIIFFIVSISLVYKLSTTGLGWWWGVLVTVCFVSFYPFLDWSTYFLTDTIGYGFWLIQLYFCYQYLQKKQPRLLIFSLLAYAISLFNKEQGILFIFILVGLFIFSRKLPALKKSQQQIKNLLISYVLIAGIFFIFSAAIGQRSVLDRINYTHNQYGLYNQVFTLQEMVVWQMTSIVKAHQALVLDLFRYRWWLIFLILASLDIFRRLFSKQRFTLIELLILFSGVCSYIQILYPDFSYKFFYAAVLAVIYFATSYLKNYFKLYEKK